MMTTARLRPHLTVGSCCLGMLAVGANGTAIMAAIPTIQRDIGLDAQGVHWAVNAYLVASAACIILGGKISDRVGARSVAIFGLLLFASASAAIATAETPAWLLTGRVLQGLGAAFALPGTLAAIGTVSSPEVRASAIGAWAGFLMLGFSIGPLMGGALTHYVGWRSVFWCGALLMLAAAAGLLSARSTEAGPRTRGPVCFDTAGFLLLAIFMVSVTFALQGVTTILNRPFTIAAQLALAAGALMLFVQIERRARDPFIKLPTLNSPLFVNAAAIGSITMFCILSFLLYFNLDAQSSHGLALTAMGAGLSLLPLSVGLLAFAFLAPHLSAQFGSRIVITGAMLVLAIASSYLAIATLTGTLLPVLGGLFVMGAALALPYATAPRLALAALPSGQAGQSSGVVNACTFLGGSSGIAINAVAYELGRLPAVLVVLAAAALLGAWVAWHIHEVAPRG